jgi:RNA polymerase sigma-70 factor (ECF subfamily)
MSPTGDDDELLAERAPGRAGAAFAVFYERHEDAVLAYFRRRVGSPELAADLTAETFAQALVSRRRYRPGAESSSVAWLFGIAGHVLGRSVRRGAVERRARRRLGVTELVLDDAQLIAIDELSSERAALAALESLPVDQREAIRARILDEKTYPEVAEQLRCSEPVARKRVSRGLAALRNRLEDTR